MLMGVTYAMAGNRKAVEEELARLRALAQKSYVPVVYPAFVCVALNDLDGVFDALYQACEERSSYLIFLDLQPAFENLRLDPRHKDLLKRIGPR
jgi:hypothetical protein